MYKQQLHVCSCFVQYILNLKLYQTRIAGAHLCPCNSSNNINDGITICIFLILISKSGFLFVASLCLSKVIETYDLLTGILVILPPYLKMIKIEIFGRALRYA